jgi:hypothetical protein
MHAEHHSPSAGRTPSSIRDHDWSIYGPLPEPVRNPDEPGSRRPGHPGMPGSQRRRRRGPQDRRLPVPTPAPEVQCWLI